MPFPIAMVLMAAASSAAQAYQAKQQANAAGEASRANAGAAAAGGGGGDDMFQATQGLDENMAMGSSTPSPAAGEGIAGKAAMNAPPPIAPITPPATAPPTFGPPPSAMGPVGMPPADGMNRSAAPGAVQQPAPPGGGSQEPPLSGGIDALSDGTQGLDVVDIPGGPKSGGMGGLGTAQMALGAGQTMQSLFANRGKPPAGGGFAGRPFQMPTTTPRLGELMQGQAAQRRY